MNMRGKIKEKLEAIKLRKEEGLSISELATKLNVSESSISTWVRGVPLTDKQKDRLVKKFNDNRTAFANRFARKDFFGNTWKRDKCLKIRRAYQEEGKILAKKRDPNFIAGIMLYWAEGSKSKNSVGICNSDPELLKFFLNFLRLNFNIEEEKICVYISCYSKNGLSEEEIKRSWIKILSVKDNNIKKIQMDKDKRIRSNENIGKAPLGICTIYVNRTDIVQKIYGAIQEFAGYKTERWIDR